MLRKEERLNRKNFTKIFSQGFFVSTNLFSLRVQNKKIGEAEQLAVVVPALITKNKPLRNRLKRQTYSIIQKIKSNFKGKFSAIIFFKKEGKGPELLDLEKGIVEIFKKAKLLK